MAKRPLTVDMLGILDALTLPPEIDCRLDFQSGEVVFRDEDEDPDDETDHLEPIPRIESREHWAAMRAFADGIDEPDLRAQLDLALAGRGAFSRFRDVVHRHADVKAAWFAHERELLLEKARAWLDELDLEPVFDELPPVVAEAAPSPPPKAPVGLLDLLLLGAPDGKTELLDGRTYRIVVARTPDDAGAVFRRVAREMCEWHGVAWRRRFIEGQTTYDHGRYHLVLDGSAVELSIEVSRELWNAFAGAV